MSRRAVSDIKKATDEKTILISSSNFCRKEKTRIITQQRFKDIDDNLPRLEKDLGKYNTSVQKAFYLMTHRLIWGLKENDLNPRFYPDSENPIAAFWEARNPCPYDNAMCRLNFSVPEKVEACETYLHDSTASMFNHFLRKIRMPPIFFGRNYDDHNDILGIPDGPVGLTGIRHFNEGGCQEWIYQSDLPLKEKQKYVMMFKTCFLYDYKDACRYLERYPPLFGI